MILMRGMSGAPSIDDADDGMHLHHQCRPHVWHATARDSLCSTEDNSNWKKEGGQRLANHFT